MKRTLITIAAAIGFSIVPPTTLFAQSAEASYNVPFSFNAAGVQLPSGRYIVSNTGPQVSKISGFGGSILYISVPELSSKPSTAHLMFCKVGGTYFLQEVWQSNGTGTRIKVRKQEQEIVQSGQREKRTSTTVLLASTR
jgi:hypothetical protein